MKISFTFQLAIAGFFAAISMAARAETCTVSGKVTGFSQVKGEKAYFHAEPNEKNKKKTYLVRGNFVQAIGVPEGGFSCVTFRNYDGHGGKQTTGWMLTSLLEPIRTKLERKDLIARWNKSPCSDESCVIEIESSDGKLEISLNSYLHDRPGENYHVGAVRESEGHLVLTNLSGSATAPKRMEIEFGNTSEPGTINLTGAEGWAGVYRR